MGQLRTRKRGKTWEYSFEGATVDGKRKPISKGGFRTKGDAITAGTKAKAEYDNCGRTFSPSTISVADYLDYWLEAYAKGLSYNSYRDYESKIRLHLKPAFGHYRLSSLEPDMIQKWIYKKKDEGLSKSMLNNIRGCLSGAMSYAVTPCKYIKHNPCDGVKIGIVNENVKLKEHREYICDKETFQKIIDRFPEENAFYLPLMIGYHLGTRIGETYGFNLLEDVDFENHTIRVERQIKRENGVWVYRGPKYNSKRTLLMGKTIENALRREITNRKKNMLKYGEYYTKSYLMDDNSISQALANVEVDGKEIMPLCVKENGELLQTESFKYCARVCHHKLGLPFFHSHCLRHTHGTILAENGASPRTVMERLGHKDISVTMNTYVFDTDKMKQEAVNIFEQAIM